MNRIAILISGTGSNMDAILDRIDSGHLDSQVAFVASDRPDALGIAKAARRGIMTEILPYGEGRAQGEARLVELCLQRKPDWLVLAGFMRIMSPSFVSSHQGRIINIHPALLPSFPGAHGIDDAWKAGVKVTGVTVHLVDELVDHGRILAQIPVRIKESDDLAKLEKRIHRAEHRIYWRTLKKLFDGNIPERKDGSR